MQYISALQVPSRRVLRTSDSFASHKTLACKRITLAVRTRVFSTGLRSATGRQHPSKKNGVCIKMRGLPSGSPHLKVRRRDRQQKIFFFLAMRAESAMPQRGTSYLKRLEIRGAPAVGGIRHCCQKKKELQGGEIGGLKVPHPFKKTAN